MVNVFRKILIPVDFTFNSDIAISKALDLIDSENGQIILIHLIKPFVLPRNFFGPHRTSETILPHPDQSECRGKMNDYKLRIQKRFPEVQVRTQIHDHMKLQEGIIQSAYLLTPDLILIGKCAGRHLVPFANRVFPARIARKTYCPVLTVKPGAMENKIKNIVLPITNKDSERKLDMAIRIANKFNAKIHLLSFQASPDYENNEVGSLFESFRRIKEKVPLFVMPFPQQGNSFAKSTLSYAEMINADMILANSKNESCVFSIVGNRHLSDLLVSSSPIQIMDIIPYF